MNPPKRFEAEIIAFAGTSPGPSSVITYTARLFTGEPPNGYTDVPGIKPRKRFWPDTLNIDAAWMVGMPIDALRYPDGAWVFSFIEAPEFGPCP